MQNESGNQPEQVIRAKIRELVAHQYAANSTTTPKQIKQLDCPPYRINPQLIPFLLKERASVLEVLSTELANAQWPEQLGLLGYFLASTEEYIYHHNQFITLSEQDEKLLVAVYTDFLTDHARVLAMPSSEDELRAELEKLMRRHLMLLHAFIKIISEKYGANQDQSLIDNEAVCAEYSARAQLEALGIDEGSLAALREPILDIGCGKHGVLVGYLRAQGKEAFGIDRLVEPNPGLLQADWLHFDYAADSWGTLISHMAFSNHFIFHHLYKEGEHEAYARKYIEILTALKQGGSFYYAPGLPFIEPLLPAARFGVVRRAVALSNGMSEKVSQTQRELLGESALYATRIVKLG
jgi:hypothetical protein